VYIKPILDVAICEFQSGCAPVSVAAMEEIKRTVSRSAWIGFGVMFSGLLAPAHAETLRCNGAIIEVGDSRLNVLYRCGQPLLKDAAFCPPVYYGPSVQPVPPPFASVVPCLVVDQWLYDRGAGNLVATVRFREGVVLSITYSPRMDP
jgi:Protein of unknown function (DUF2845)